MTTTLSEEELDSDILTSIAVTIINNPDGMNKLVEAAMNTSDPAKGVAQYLMMMFDAVSQMLEQTGLPFDFGVITATGGVLDNLIEEVIQILTEADVEVGSGFEKSLVGNFLEMVKAAAQAEEGAAPQPAQSVGTATAEAGGLLDEVSMGGGYR